jgi:RNA polymerase sigma-70 factor (ECF subfamily)
LATRLPPESSEKPPTTVSLRGLYSDHAASVSRWASQFGIRPEDLEDIVQEVFLVVQRKLSGFEGKSSLATWIFKITYNVVRHRRRQDRWRKWLAGSSTEAAGHLPSLRPGAYDELARAEQNDAVRRVLDGIPEKYRTVLCLFEMEELSCEEIAGLLDLKPTTVRVRLHRARQRFLDHMQVLERKGVLHVTEDLRLPGARRK